MKRLIWHNPKEGVFEICGLAWFEKERVYRRLLVKPSYRVSEVVDKLADCTAGSQIRFKTDSNLLRIKVLLSGKSDIPYMPATGQSGFDCYIGSFGNYRYLKTTKFFPVSRRMYEFTFFEFKDKKRRLRDVTLNFPLYNGVKKVSIGLEEGSSILPPEIFRVAGKIIVYGTSITQGGCASRPGMAYTNILSRWLGIEFINLGFSGSGRGEPEMARIITQIGFPVLYILDYEGNSGGLKYYRKTLPQFIRILRKAQPKIPILVISHIPYSAEIFDAEVKKAQRDRKKFTIELVKKLRSGGDKNMYFKDGYELLGKDFYECTVDGVHPTDLGFMRMAEGLFPVIKNILNI